jgi:hypothetical protein
MRGTQVKVCDAQYSRIRRDAMGTCIFSNLLVIVSGLLACSCGGSKQGTCDDAWNKAAAACPSAASTTAQQQFLQQCNNPQSFRGCESQASALTDCVKKSSSFTCNSNGQPSAVGCSGQANAFGACILGQFDAGLPSDLDVAAPDLDAGGASADAGAAVICDGQCSTTFASGPDWQSFSGDLSPAGGSPDASYTVGVSLGSAAEVCLTPSVPANCPAGMSGVVIYHVSGTGWAGGSAIPQAHWIWRGDVSPTAPADLVVGVFEQAFQLGTNPTGSIQIAVDDFAEVFVNGAAVGTAGSISDVALAGQDQSVAKTLDLTPALHAGSNKITVVGRNGPAAFAGGCGASGCTYAQNSAGVVFAGTLSWR